MDEMGRHKESEVARKVKSILEKEEEVLARAVAQTMRAYNESPATKNLKEWDAARTRFTEFQKRKAVQADPESRRFDNLLEVLGYLTDEGWKIKKTKLYADQNKIGREKDGTYSKKALDEYARRALRKTDGSDEAYVEEARRKAKLEIDVLEEDFKKKRRANEIECGLWTRTSDIESMFAGRAALLKNGIGPEFIHSHAPQLVTLVSGDQSKVPDLIEYWLRAVEEFMNRYSAPVEFAVPVQLQKEEE